MNNKTTRVSVLAPDGKPLMPTTSARPFGYRLGDYVQAEKAGKVYFGWVGGFTDSEKTKKISLYDINWNRIGQFSLSKVKRLRRKSGLLVSW